MSVFLRKCGSHEEFSDLTSNCQVHAHGRNEHAGVKRLAMRPYHKTCKNLQMHTNDSSLDQCDLSEQPAPKKSKCVLRHESSKQSERFLQHSSWMQNAEAAASEADDAQRPEGTINSTIEPLMVVDPVQFHTREPVNETRGAVDLSALNSLDYEEDTARFQAKKLKHQESVNSLLEMECETGGFEGATDSLISQVDIKDHATNAAKRSKQEELGYMPLSFQK